MKMIALDYFKGLIRRTPLFKIDVSLNEKPRFLRVFCFSEIKLLQIHFYQI